MSTTLVKDEIAKFIADPESSVICIRGKWGTGKTFSWKKALSDAAKLPKGLSKETYCYISLFGLNSLTEVKRELFHNIVRRKNIGKEFDAEEVRQSYQKARDLTKIGSNVIANLIPGGTSEAGGTLTFLTVRDQLICIDDLERKGQDLRTVDVLGLVSMLKEDRNCKVALLLNDEALQGKDEADFKSYLEKVVDVTLRYDPKPQESAEIALPEDDPISAMVRERCITLGIDNIRVIRKIFRSIQQLKPLMEPYREAVFHDAIHAMVLLAWAHHEPELAPSKEFLGRHRSFMPEDNELPPKEAFWKTLVDKYRYFYLDDFRQALLDGIEDGYFSWDELKPHVELADKTYEGREAEMDYAAAWHDFHYSFTIEIGPLLDRMYTAFKKNVWYLNVENVNATYRFFKTYEDARADEILQTYLEARKGERVFDTSDVYMPRDEFVPEVKQALDEAHKGQEPDLGIAELFVALTEDGNKQQHIVKVAQLPVEEYIRVLKANSGAKLREIMSALFQYTRYGNPTESMKTITEKTKSALTIIAAESPLNAHRAKGWGIKVGEDVPADEHHET